MKGHTRRLAAFSATLTYEAIPPSVIEMVKRLLLDTLGTTLAATTLGAGCRETAQVMRELGGKPESTILGFGGKVAAPNAAFANGACAHALNYDPIGPESGHVGVVCLTAPLAIAEKLGGVSGKEFLVAATVASEVNARVTAAQARTGKTPSDKFMAGQLFGYFGAAASAGRLLHLNAEQIRSAFGLALMQTSGTMQVVLGGDPPAKAVYGAFPNHGGVLAALLSAAGLGGECDAFEGVAGLYEMFYKGDYREGALSDDLGTEFLLMGTQFKPWPTSMIAHAFIEAAGELAKAGVKPSAIEQIEVIGDPHIRPWCEPLDERRAPKNAASAANSIPFGVAKALLYGDLTLKDFTPQGVRDDKAVELAQRITYSFKERVEGGIVKITTRDGATKELHVRFPLGHLSRPVPMERLIAKFEDCCRYAVHPLSGDKVKRLADLIANLENSDVRELAATTAS
jgi:2-methylcitrate dehydratase PrpD